MTEIKTIEGGQKDVLLRRANIKNNYSNRASVVIHSLPHLKLISFYPFHTPWEQLNILTMA